jgi:hypothetical protein
MYVPAVNGLPHSPLRILSSQSVFPLGRPFVDGLHEEYVTGRKEIICLGTGDNEVPVTGFLHSIACSKSDVCVVEIPEYSDAVCSMPPPLH